MNGVEGDTGKVVNAVAAFSDNRVKLVETDSTSIVALQRTVCHEPAVMHREDQGVEQLLVAMVEWDVDENPIVIARHDSEARGRPRLSYSRDSFVPSFLAAVFLRRMPSLSAAWRGCGEDRVTLRPPVSPNCPRKRSQNRRRFGEAFGFRGAGSCLTAGSRLGSLRRQRAAARFLPADGSSLAGTENRPVAHRFRFKLDSGFIRSQGLRDATMNVTRCAGPSNQNRARRAAACHKSMHPTGPCPALDR